MHYQAVVGTHGDFHRTRPRPESLCALLTTGKQLNNILCHVLWFDAGSDNQSQSSLRVESICLNPVIDSIGSVEISFDSVVFEA